MNQERAAGPWWVRAALRNPWPEGTTHTDGGSWSRRKDDDSGPHSLRPTTLDQPVVVFRRSLPDRLLSTVWMPVLILVLATGSDPADPLLVGLLVSLFAYRSWVEWRSKIQVDRARGLITVRGLRTWEGRFDDVARIEKRRWGGWELVLQPDAAARGRVRRSRRVVPNTPMSAKDRRTLHDLLGLDRPIGEPSR